MDALHKECLYCNVKKSEFFKYELKFLGHKISVCGIEPDNSKVARILHWAVPKTAGDAHAFLGLVCYLASFLQNLAKFTSVLTPLTDVKSSVVISWTEEHQSTFDSIKRLVVAADCLTVIDHLNPGENKIFVTTDASDRHTGAVFSWGPTWETARPVAYDLMQLKGAQLHYPVHEKELLDIVRALKKWRADLLGNQFEVFTDHRTLENFQTQKALSC